MRVLVVVAGGLLTLAGVALLILPGPGFVLVALGLAVLGTQYEWAAAPLGYAKGRAEQGVDEVARSLLSLVVSLAGAAALVVLGVLGIAGVDIPFLSPLTGVLLVLSGLFLIATVVYARTGWNRPRARRKRARGGRSRVR